jgi:hypothetical protein
MVKLSKAQLAVLKDSAHKFGLRNYEHIDFRTLNSLMDRGLVVWQKPCSCDHVCSCGRQYITATEAGRNLLSSEAK